MEYLLGGLIVWGMISLPLGLILGRMFNRMEHGQHEKGYATKGYTSPQQFPMFTYVGPAPVMPLERYDDEDDETPERMN